MSGYRCPDCGGDMHTSAKMTDPPIYEAKCYDCGVLYRRERCNDGKSPLPRDYQRIGKALT